MVQWFRTFTIMAWVQSVVRELKSSKSHSHAAKKKKKEEEEEGQIRQGEGTDSEIVESR